MAVPRVQMVVEPPIADLRLEEQKVRLVQTVDEDEDISLDLGEEGRACMPSFRRRIKI